MLDLCLIKNRWRNFVKDVHAKPGEYYQSDHALVEVTVRMKLKRKYKYINKHKTPKYRSPNKEEIEKINGNSFHKHVALTKHQKR